MTLPDSDNVARYCRPSSVDPATNRPNIAAFEFKTYNDGKWESYLSVDWLEFLHAQPAASAAQIATLRDFLKQPHGLPVLKMRPNGCFAVLPVQKIHAASGQLFRTVLQCVHEPRNGATNDPHSGVRPDPGVEHWPPPGGDSVHLAIQQYLLLSMSYWERVGEAIPP